MILGKTAQVIEPCKCAFYDPAFLDPVNELAGITAVEYGSQRGKSGKPSHQPGARTGSVLDTQRIHHRREQPALGIDGDVPLAVFAFLARVHPRAAPFLAVS